MRCQQPCNTEDNQRAPHTEGQDYLRFAEGFDSKSIEQTKDNHHPHAHHPRGVMLFHHRIEVFKVHQRHDPGENGFGGAGENMDDEISGQRAGDGEKTPHAAGDVVIN